MILFIFLAFIASASILFLFYSLVSIAISSYKQPVREEYKIPGISIVICARNESENLKKLIPLLLKQQFETFEIILVDDRSSDETYDFGLELDHNESKFKLVRIDSTPDHINNKKFAITMGIRTATYDHVLLTDADCFPQNDNWVEEMSQGFCTDDKKFVIGYSQYYLAKGFLNQFIRFETLYTAMKYFGIGLLGNPYMGVGRNIAYRKSFFLENNGFGKHQSVVGGDDDLLVNRHAKRKNTSFMVTPGSVMLSNPKTSWKEFWLQKTRHLSVGKHYKKSDKMLLGLVSLSKIIFWFSFFAVIMAGFQTYFALGGFLLVMVSLLTSLVVLKKKTGDDSSISFLPIVDFIYTFYFILTGLKVLFTKKVKWK